MANETAIGWTDVTWNPTHGCSIVSDECRHCYAAELSLRYGQTLKPWTPANAAENVILKPHKLREPLGGGKAWRGLGAAAARAGKTDGKLVFVNSMSDLFHELIPERFIDSVFATMAWAPQHTFQILTKRPERMRHYLTHSDREQLIHSAMCEVCSSPGTGHGICDDYGNDDCGLDSPVWPLPNVWLGVSIGKRNFIRRADHLRDTPAAVRFVSAEPLLGPLIPPWTDASGINREPLGLDVRGLDWLIVGGESGSEHRTMDVDWLGALHEECAAKGVAFFAKQDSGTRPGKRGRIPSDLWVQEFPGKPAPTVLEGALF